MGVSCESKERDGHMVQCASHKTGSINFLFGDETATLVCACTQLRSNVALLSRQAKRERHTQKLSRV